MLVIEQPSFCLKGTAYKIAKIILRTAWDSTRAGKRLKCCNSVTELFVGTNFSTVIFRI